MLFEYIPYISFIFFILSIKAILNKEIGLMKFFIVLLQFIYLCLLSQLYAQERTLSQFSISQEYYSKAKAGTKAVYGWNFGKAEEIESYFIANYPTHPTGYFIKSMRIYWQNYPLEEESEEYKTHMRLLKKSYELAAEISKKNSKNKDAVLFKLLTKSAMIRNYDAYNKTMKAVGASREIYKLMMKAIDMKDDYIEFYFPSGLYNYYREYYPDEYPIYKPFMFFFRSGDKELGIKELNIAVRKAVFTYPEAVSYLAKIYFYIEEEKEKGIVLFAKLDKTYPNNSYFKLDYLNALVELEDYEKIKKVAYNLYDGSPYYQMGKSIYQGIYQQKVKKNQQSAKALYESAMKIDQETRGFGKRYYFHLYKGLADYWQSKGNLEKEAYFRKKAKNEKDD